MWSIREHMLGDHKSEIDAQTNSPTGLNPTSGSNLYDVDTMHELHRLFVPGDEELSRERVIGKTILALPLMGHDNGAQVFLRPQMDLFTGLAEKFAKHSFKKMQKITCEPGCIAIDTHVHTCYSHDSLANISTVLLAAYSRGLAGIAITDHDTMAGIARASKDAKRLVHEGRLPADFFIIPGEEIGSTNGHIIGIFLKKEIPSGMTAAETVDAIHEQGGIAIAAHPLIEHGLGNLANTLPFDAVESKNEAEVLKFSAAKPEARKNRNDFYAGVIKPQIGSSDSHDAWSVGSCYTILQCEPTPKAVKAAILAGNTIAASDVPENNDPQATNKKRSRALSVLAFARNIDTGICRLTHACSADISVWPDQSLHLLWAGKF